IKIFRVRTARVNVVYQIVKINRIGRQREKEKIILDLIKRKLERYKTGKIVVYYNIIRKVKKIIGVLDYNIYYYHTVEKDSMLKEFIKEK
ncbi:hypothetical protein K469DRAFT_605164, partial [Zopfia rhizophila CBS 207.26]